MFVEFVDGSVDGLASGLWFRHTVSARLFGYHVPDGFFAWRPGFSTLRHDPAGGKENKADHAYGPSHGFRSERDMRSSNCNLVGSMWMCKCLCI